MDIKVNQKEDNITLEITGRIDTTTSPEFEKTVREHLNPDIDLILDFEHVEYISSAALRVLLQTHKSMNGKGKMILTHVNDVVREVLDITGFIEIIHIEDDHKE